MKLVSLLEHLLATAFDEGIEFSGKLGHAIAQVLKPKVDARQRIGHGWRVCRRERWAHATRRQRRLKGRRHGWSLVSGRVSVVNRRNSRTRRGELFGLSIRRCAANPPKKKKLVAFLHFDLLCLISSTSPTFVPALDMVWPGVSIADTRTRFNG